MDIHIVLQVIQWNSTSSYNGHPHRHTSHTMDIHIVLQWTSTSSYKSYNGHPQRPTMDIHIVLQIVHRNGKCHDYIQILNDVIFSKYVKCHIYIEITNMP